MAPAPPRTSGDEPRGNIERDRTRFVGREEDLSALTQAVAASRLVTVLGPPGTGKTRLARELCERRTRQPGGEVPAGTGGSGGSTWFCDLTEATDAEDICAAVARALGVSLTRAGTTADAVSRLGHVLDAHGALLLVVDNFEQVVRWAGTTVGAWLRRAEAARFLVTSRQRLGLPGEVLFDLGPLSLPRQGDRAEASEAVQLFVDRARAVRRDWSPAGDMAAVVALVENLDGLPLAIELAAARMRLLSPAQILANMPRRFQLLKGSPERGRARHSTLWNALEWSWGLLEPWEQSALAQCSVFRGGFDLESAEAVVDLSAYAEAPWTLDVLQALRDKSLLTTEAGSAAGVETRLGLYASVRAYAADKLVALGLEDAAVARHAAHYLARGRALAAAIAASNARDGGQGGGEAPGAAHAEAAAALARLVPEVENLLAVFRRAVEQSARTGSFRVGMVGPALPPPRANRALAAALVLSAALARVGPFGLCLSVLDSAVACASVLPGAGEPASDLPPAGVDAHLFARVLAARAAMKTLAGRDSDGAADVARAQRVAASVGDAALAAEVSSRHPALSGARPESHPPAGASAPPSRAGGPSSAASSDRSPVSGDAGAASSDRGGALIVSGSGRWFQREGGERVSLQRRRALHLVVKALADTRGAHPGRALTVPELVEHGWPGEKVQAEAGADRVYMALSTLRKMGLRGVIISRDDGYLLDPRVELRREPD
jgi:predicted ATPase